MVWRTSAALLILMLAQWPSSAAAEPNPIVVELSGAAGEWVVLFGDLPDHPRSLSWYFTFDFEAVGDGTRPIHAFLSPPVLIAQGDGEANPNVAGLAQSASIHVSQSSTLAHSVVSNSVHSLWGHTFAGWAVVAGADAPWTLDLLAARHGADLSDVSVVRGSGLQFATAASEAVRPDVEAASAGSSRAELRETFAAPGWSHLEYNLAPPNGPFGPTHHAQDLAFFPNGHVHLEVGAIVQVLGFASHTSSAVGTFADEAGEFNATFDRLGWSLDFSLALVHLPIAPDQFPSGWAPLSYRCTAPGSGFEICSATFSTASPQSV